MDFIVSFFLFWIISIFVIKKYDDKKTQKLENEYKSEINELNYKINQLNYEIEYERKAHKRDIGQKEILIKELKGIIKTSTKHPDINEDKPKVIDEPEIEIKNPEIFDYITKLIDEGKNLFITGGAGTGKSFILNQLRKNYEIAVTSTTGISAINIGGQTIHSWSGVGLCNKPEKYVIQEIIYNRPILVKQITDCKILAIDEISMLNAKNMDYINTVLKVIRGKSDAFGGLQILLFGDFFQLPPVKTNNFCFESMAWKELNLTPVILKTVYRQDNLHFIEALSNARIGKLQNKDISLFSNQEAKFDTINSPILHIFSTNNEADTHNKWKFDQIEKPSQKFISIDKIYNYKNDGSISETLIRDDNIIFENKADLKAIENLDKDCKAPRMLELKEGCKVMLLKNLNFQKNLVNGSTGIIEEISEKSIMVYFDNHERQPIGRICFEYYSGGVLKATRHQFPLRLAYGITIHKSQGTTLENVIINFNKIFENGQAYVALSRTRSLEGLHLKHFNPKKIAANKKIVEFYDFLENSHTVFKSTYGDK